MGARSKTAEPVGLSRSAQFAVTACSLGLRSKTELKEYFSDQRKLAGSKLKFDEENILKIINTLHPAHSTLNKLSADANPDWPSTICFFGSCPGCPEPVEVSQSAVFLSSASSYFEPQIRTAFRNTVASYVWHVKNDKLVGAHGDQIRCAKCRLAKPRHLTDMHHRGPTFKYITDAFLKTEGLTLLDVEITQVRNRRLPADENLRERFIKYHAIARSPKGRRGNLHARNEEIASLRSQ